MDWTPMIDMVESIGRRDAAFDAALPTEMTLAEQYRSRLAMIDPATPDADEFSIIFRVFLSALSAAKPGLPVQALTPLAIDRAMWSASVDVDEADLREPTPETISEAIALRVASSEIEEAYDLIVDGNGPDPIDTVRTRAKRHREIAGRRLATMPGDGGEMSMADQIDLAVAETIVIADLGDEEAVADWMTNLIETGSIEAEGSDGSEPIEDVIAVLAAEASRAGLDGKATATVARRAVEASLQGDYPTADMLCDLPAARFRGDESHAFGIANGLGTTIGTMLHIGGILGADDPTAGQLGHAAASRLIDEARSAPDGTDGIRHMVEMAIGTVHEVAKTRIRENVTAHDAGEHIASLLRTVDSQTVDRILTTGEMVTPPLAGEEVRIAHAFVAHNAISDAAAERLDRAFKTFDPDAVGMSVPSGTFWLSPNDMWRTWKDVTTSARTLSSVTGVRYAALPVTVGRIPYMLVHDGRRAMLVDISVTPTMRKGQTD